MKRNLQSAARVIDFPSHYAGRFEKHVDRPAMLFGMFLADLYIPRAQRGRGIGRTIVHALVREADRTSRHIFLQAFPYESREKAGSYGAIPFREAQARLISFYTAFGFVDVGFGWMYRVPASTHRAAA